MADPTATKTITCPRCGEDWSELAVVRAAQRVAPSPDAPGLREAAERVVGRFLDTPASLAGVHVAALNDLRDALAAQSKEPTP